MLLLALDALILCILYPAIFGVFNSKGCGRFSGTPDEREARNIANALRAYETEYGWFPPLKNTNQTVEVSGELLEALSGSSSPLNPRGIPFTELRPRVQGKSGVEDGVWKDSEGNPFRVSLDTDSNNHVTVSLNGELSGTNVIPKKVAVWNLTSDPDQQARSWAETGLSLLGKQKHPQGMWNDGRVAENIGLYLAPDGSGDFISHRCAPLHWSYDSIQQIVTVHLLDAEGNKDESRVLRFQYAPRADALTALSDNWPFKRQTQSSIDSWLEVKKKNAEK